MFREDIHMCEALLHINSWRRRYEDTEEHGRKMEKFIVMPVAKAIEKGGERAHTVAPQRGGGTAAVIQRGSGALCALRRDAAPQLMPPKKMSILVADGIYT